jgi:RHS repeat-associated protein
MEPGLRTLSIKADENEQVTVVKSFNVPVDFTFDISDNNFEIRYNDDMYTESAAYDVLPGHGGHSASSGNFYSSSATTLSNSTMGIFRTSEMFNTYYIYTFDGKLLAEYDHNGNCTRDYIYFGKRMLAEYKPQTGEYFYYMSEQINSTRIITNDNGDVVFSEAYGSYGDVQKTWVNAYDPDLKFSGKEREGYSGLDYFGARYYDHKNYRFNSVDPVITKDEALSNPQLWNLYAYCSNNPITHLDPDGRRIVIDQGQYHNEIQNAVDIGRGTQSGGALFQQLDNDPRAITLRGGTLGVQNNSATCGEKTGHTLSGNYIDSVEFTIDFGNIQNYHSDTTGVTTVWHELFHASAYMQSSQSTGITWIQAQGIAWRQDQPIQGGQGTGTQRGAAGQFGANVLNQALANLFMSIRNML